MRFIGKILNVLSYVLPKLVAKTAFFLFCYPVRIKIKPYHLAFLNTATKEAVLVNNKKVAVYKWGNGPQKILFLHGWNSFSFRWKKYIEALDKTKFTVLAVDAPGCGLSEGNQLQAIIYSQVLVAILTKYNGIDTLVAHSFGSVATLFTLHELKDTRIKKAILMGAPTEIEDLFHFFVGQLNLNKRVHNGLRHTFLEKFGKEPSYFSLIAFAQKIDIPVLVIHDKEDEVCPFMGAQKMANNFKNGRLLVTTGLGHNLKGDLPLMAVCEFCNNNVSLKTKYAFNKIEGI